MPPYELLGFHGFTGLNYIATPGSSVDVQFICEASLRNEERPKPLHAGEPGEPPREPPPPPPSPVPAPFRVRCETTMVDPSTATLDTDSFVLEGARQRTLTLGPHQLELRLFDAPYEARGFQVSIPGVVQQLFQLDRTKPVTDVTRGPGGLTGTTVVRSKAGDSDGGDGDGDGDAGQTSDGGGGDRIITVACGAAPS